MADEAVPNGAPLASQSQATASGDLGDLVRRGHATLKWSVFDVCHVILHARPDDHDLRGELAFAFDFLRPVANDVLVTATVDEVVLMSGPADGRASGWRDFLSAILPSVVRGDRLVVRLGSDGKAVFFRHAGHLGTLQDQVFVEGFREIWIGPASREPAVRQQLLSGRPLRN